MSSDNAWGIAAVVLYSTDHWIGATVCMFAMLICMLGEWWRSR